MATPMNKSPKPVDYDYHEYHIHIRYRPKYKDFHVTISRTVEISHQLNAQSLEAAKRAADKFVDTIKAKRA